MIGAGVGGIAAAAHLARRGLKVTVLEKNGQAGGRLNQFERQGHRFDSGPTLLVLPDVYRAEFATLEADSDELLEPRRVDPSYHLVYDDGRRLRLTADLEDMRAQLESFEPGSFEGFLRYMQEGARHYRQAMKHWVLPDFRQATDFFTPGNLARFFRLRANIPHYRNMRSYFDSPELRAAFTFQDIYLGLSPFAAPATFSMFPYAEWANGVWYPRGGMYAIVEALMEIARQAGVEFLFHASVERIDVEGGLARGVTLADGRRLRGDAVLANADLPYVYRDLLPPDGRAERLARRQFSCSVISFLWGLDRRCELSGPHTLFLSDAYQRDFRRLERREALPDTPSLYLHSPTLLDASAAPHGQDSLTAIVPVGHIDPSRGQDWETQRDQARRAVFQRLASLGIRDLADHIKFEVCYTPPSWRKRYNLMNGSTQGLSHTVTQMGYFPPANRHPHYRNLYFVGASTRPGTGVPTALISARLSAGRLLDDLGMHRPPHPGVLTP